MDTKYVLIVEDSSAQAMAIRYLLESKGVEVLWASNGWEGIELAQKYQPGAIVLDIQMPEMDGFEVCRQLKACAETNQIPVIMYTSREFAPDLMYSLDLGAVDFIPKDSFSGTVLLATLQELGLLPPQASDSRGE